MKLMTKTQKEKLLENGRRQQEAGEKDTFIDFKPVIKLFNPCGGGTWLLSELYPSDNDIAFGLCDLGMGFPELGDVRISELKNAKLLLPHLGIERDRHWTAQKTLSDYEKEASDLGHIKA